MSDEAIRVGVNGFGRIGRNFLRALLSEPPGEGAPVEVVAVNDLTSADMLAHLLRYDSTHGALRQDVVVDGPELVVGGRRIRVLAERDPARLPWKELGVRVAIESTGRFTDRTSAASHLDAGAERVVISAPAKQADATFVVGVNDHTFDPQRHFVVSNASCTTNCFVPMVKVLDDAFGVVSGLMTTVHAYTNDQNLLDLPHSDARRARAAAVNIVPTSTGAARATGMVMASVNGLLDGMSLRVPVPDGSLTDFTAVVRAVPDVDGVNAAFAKAASSPPLSHVLDYTEEPLVSSDVVGRPASCTFDAGLTMVQRIDDEQALVKVNGWYDNEWGYSSRLVDLTRIVAGAR